MRVCVYTPFLTHKARKKLTPTSSLRRVTHRVHGTAPGPLSVLKSFWYLFLPVSRLILQSEAQIPTLHVRLNEVYTFLHGRPAPPRHRWLMLPDKQPLVLSSDEGPGVGPSGRATPLADVRSRIPEVTPDVGTQLCSQSTLSVFIPCIIAK